MNGYTGPGVVLRFGELFLKGKNRYLFEDILERNVRWAVAQRDDVVVHRKHGRMFVLGADDERLMHRLGEVFGIASCSPAVFCDKTLEAMTQTAVKMAQARASRAKTFRISARRSDKGFAKTSGDLNRIVGAAVVQATGLRVDLESHDLEIGIEVGLDWAFVWSSGQPGPGGLPVGVSGRGLLLLSGGIDSPVAGHLMQKRGLALSAVYFHSFPYTGDGARDKVVRLATVLAQRQKELPLFVVPFARIQELLRDHAEAKYLVLLYRRAMMRIAGAIAHQRGIHTLITGESLGQVASQTLANLAAIEDAADLPILRPLIGYDKAEAIALAKKIGTYDISIAPHDDCCSLFVPKHPETRAKLKYIRAAEAAIDWGSHIEEAIEQAQMVQP
ncbi:MAG: tRNA uracil 4-sulfurtransferase ThiI [Myxococcota bacterium]|nr:tRNA uracil 4-sulfurtransferase ThiI [Myxococcota bacterium]